MGYINFFLHKLGDAMAGLLGLLPVQHFTPLNAASSSAIAYYAGFVNYFVPVGAVMAILGTAFSAFVLVVIALFVIHTVRDVIP